jgi:hypothetical protein
MAINKYDLSIFEWLWDVYTENDEMVDNETINDLSDFFAHWDWKEVKELDVKNGGNYVVIRVESFALVYRNNGQVPSKEELITPLDDSFFNEDGTWNSDEVWSYLNKSAKLVNVYIV